MKKLKRKSLDELAKTMPVLSEEEQRYYIGGSGAILGSAENPFTESQMDMMMGSGVWNGGYVLGIGWVDKGVAVFGFSGTYYTLSDYVGSGIQSGSGQVLNNLVGSLPGIGSFLTYMGQEISDMNTTIQKELLDMGYTGKDAFYISSNTVPDYSNGGTKHDLLTVGVYNAYNGQLITSWTINDTGYYRKTY